MPSSPLGIQQSRTTSGVACYHSAWTANTTAHTVERRLLWHAIIAFVQHTRSNDAGHGMTSPPLVYMHGRTTSGSCLACHYHPWTTHMVGPRRAWHDITALEQHTQSDDIEHGMPSSPLGSTNGPTTSAHTIRRRQAWHDITALGKHTRLNDVGPRTVERRLAWHDITTLGLHARSNDVLHGMISPSLGSTHTHTVERHQAWHDITPLRQHTLSNDIGRGKTLPPLDYTHGRTTSGLACNHRPWTTNKIGQRRAWHDINALGLHAWSNDVWRGMTSPPLGSIHSRQRMACHHRLWAAQTVERHWTWHDITSFGQHSRSNDVGRGMPSSPLGSTSGRTPLGMACHHRLWEAQTVE
uniref:Uncharacterized protein n=1 Tax=Solanum lycopersicum TaxID=4081 RepID=A0A3Q7HKZ5_SOLLC